MDTVIYRVHNLSSYPLLYAACTAEDRKGVETFLTKSDKVPVKQHKRVFHLNYTRDEAIPARWTDDLKIESSNHDVRYSVNWQLDYIEFNVSLPKFYFGNNVIELLTPPFHKDFTVNSVSPYQQIDFWLRTMKEVIYKLVLMVARGNQVDLDWNDVEVNRIDIAVNQVFDTMHEALKYLDYQRTIHKRFARRNRKKAADYDTTISFASERYYVKIYHKGSELRDVQEKHIRKLAAEKRKGKEAQLSENINQSEKFLPELQQYADRVLRYEFTFRPGMMSYLFNTHINKFWSRDFQSFKKIHTYLKRDPANDNFLRNHIKRYEDFNGHLHKTIIPTYTAIRYYERKPDGSLTEFTEKQYQIITVLNRYYVKTVPQLKEWLDMMDKEIGKVRSFRFTAYGYWNTLKKEQRDEKGELICELRANTPTPPVIKFGKNMLAFLIREIHLFFNNFQIETKDNTSEFRDKIDAYNAQLIVQMGKIGISPIEKAALKKKVVGEQLRRTLMQFHILHGKQLTQKQMLDQEFSRATYFRAKKLYNEIAGKNYQIAHMYFGNVNRDFNAIYKGFMDELVHGCFSKFYNVAFTNASQLV